MIGSGFLQLLREYYGAAEIDDINAFHFDNGEGGVELTFEQFVRAARALGALPDAEALRLDLLRSRSDDALGRRRERERTSGDRYDEMLRTFAEWTEGGNEARLIDAVDSPRLRTVLAGCFAGARKRAVVSALRILYVDHVPLRMGGDLIFLLMKRVVARARARTDGGMDH